MNYHLINYQTEARVADVECSLPSLRQSKVETAKPAYAGKTLKQDQHHG